MGRLTECHSCYTFQKKHVQNLTVVCFWGAIMNALYCNLKDPPLTSSNPYSKE